jgi:hypothetical protein
MKAKKISKVRSGYNQCVAVFLSGIDDFFLFMVSGMLFSDLVLTKHFIQRSFLAISSGVSVKRSIPWISLNQLWRSAFAAVIAMQINTVDGYMITAVDDQYPGTAVQRMMAIRGRVMQLATDPKNLNGKWENVRRNILWAGGLKDLPNAAPGAGYTGHSFNDFNHCDLTAMVIGKPKT